MKRRRFLQVLTADATLPLAQRLAKAAGTSYQVGAGVSSTDPYGATQRAITASGQFPNVSGKTVMIKPNLVSPKPSTSGVTTDPQVVRAIVDAALQGGASSVLIAEGGAGIPPANFTACGYGFFSSYDPKVELMDFSQQSASFVRVPNGLTFFGMYVPAPAAQSGLVFISAAKLKTHVNAGVSLSMKNVFGLAVPTYYMVPSQLARMDGHLRGIDESVVDINLARPVDFAVIDGIWGLEGNGPLSGTPVASGIVFAGSNPVAVDRVALDFMGIPQYQIPHLSYAWQKGLGPSDTSSVTVEGDSYTRTSFVQAKTSPIVWRPTPSPNPISIGAGQSTTIHYKIPTACSIAAQIIQDNDQAPAVKVVRNLQAFTSTPAGVASILWDGRDDHGAPVAPGLYLARLLGTFGSGISYTTSWILVNA